MSRKPCPPGSAGTRPGKTSHPTMAKLETSAIEPPSPLAGPPNAHHFPDPIDHRWTDDLRREPRGAGSAMVRARRGPDRIERVGRRDGRDRRSAARARPRPARVHRLLGVHNATVGSLFPRAGHRRDRVRARAIRTGSDRRPGGPARGPAADAPPLFRRRDARAASLHLRGDESDARRARQLFRQPEARDRLAAAPARIRRGTSRESTRTRRC